ncbi:MAG: hypothetical protein EZS28_003021 [Streblomastix strix]|uniref:Uncharacterized protein n=1 Tax=Streblomastix strix TaxID=222440 RepID=A0A5J4X4L5_9EUKA|nr:MAG: hypothetical protein EZS28_003014 [Streblomastix strix]KAA6401459.1 MAG: hypothetical protein EZS28_003021 [Streblomastix strix]
MELARQTHFRGYYLLNADIINLASSATGDFAFSAESGTVWMYESSWYDSGQLVPDQVTPASDELPIVDGEASAGISTSYSRGDHVHPQQLTYDNDITATKFIKTGGTNQQILLANGDTTTLDSKISRTYNSSGGGWIRLCVFPAGASVDQYFIILINGINTVYGVFTASTRISASYTIDSGVNQLFHTHTGSGTSAIYSAYVRIESTNSITIVVSDQSKYYTNRITEILSQDIVTTVSSATQIPINYSFASGGIMQDFLQVNPSSSRSKANYNNGIRIGNYTSESSIQLACSNSTISGTQTGQWEISKTSDNTLTINPSSLRQADHSVGLSINNDSTKITFNGNEQVNIGTDQSINGRKTLGGTTLGSIQLNPTDVPYGEIDGQWTIIKRNAGELYICRTADQNTDNKGLMISADGNTLTFNGSVIAGTGATSGVSNGSVNYSAGNPILWGVNSVDTNGGFYSDGPKVYWRAKPVTLGAVPP